MKFIAHILLALLMILSLTACEDLYPFLYDDDDDDKDSGGAAATSPATADNADTPEEAVNNPGTASPGSVPGDFAGVVWLHNNVSGWAQTASLSAGVSGGSIVLNYDKAHSWPEVSAGGAMVVANPWVFVYQDGTWYAATFEWLRKGQTSKPVSTVRGDHIKRAPLNNFVPQSGVRYGFMVSGLARDSTRNVQERSNVSMVTWP